MTLKQHKLTDAMCRAQDLLSRLKHYNDDHKLVGPYDFTVGDLRAMHQASIPTEATGDDVERLLKWHIPTMLRWLAENIDAPRLPDGTLTGRFLYAVAENIEARVAHATQPATDTRIPINEEATDVAVTLASIRTWVAGLPHDMESREQVLADIDQSIDRVSNDQG